MFAITKNIRTSSTYNAQIQCIKWDRYGSTKLFSWDLTAVVNNITSLVSFGTLGAVVQIAKSKTATVYKSDGTTASLTHVFVNAAAQARFDAILALNIDIRLI